MKHAQEQETKESYLVVQWRSILKLMPIPCNRNGERDKPRGSSVVYGRADFCLLLHHAVGGSVELCTNRGAVLAQLRNSIVHLLAVLTCC